MIWSGDLGQLQPVVSEEDAIRLAREGYLEPFGFMQARVFTEEQEEPEFELEL